MHSPEEDNDLVFFIDVPSLYPTLPAVLTDLSSKPVPFWIMVE